MWIGDKNSCLGLLQIFFVNNLCFTGYVHDILMACGRQHRFSVIIHQLAIFEEVIAQDILDENNHNIISHFALPP